MVIKKKLNAWEKFDKFVQEKINHENYSKYKKAQKKQWFSLGWLIFWIIICWPVSIIYLLVKYVDKEK